MPSMEVKCKVVKELLSDVRYSIDYYQREYRWDKEQIEALVSDLCLKFLEFYGPDHSRQDVAGYGNYFLGSIILANYSDDHARYLIDGQQRLTSLTLLLIYLRHRLRDRDSDEDKQTASGIEQIGKLDRLIFSDSYGEKSFNLNIPERNDALNQLYNEGKVIHSEISDLSVKQIYKNYSFIQEEFPSDINDDALPYFIDWLLEKVEMVEMSSPAASEAYTIFETMNDRGRPINPTDVLKGFVLSQINDSQKQEEANIKWKKVVDELRNHSERFEITFFKHWLRAKCAVTMRKSGVGTINQDFENINIDAEFPKWVRDNKEKMGLLSSDDFYNFSVREAPFYAQAFLMIQDARKQFNPALPFVYYNSFHGEFKFSDQLILATLDPSDSKDTIIEKMNLVSGYIDIFIARRLIAGRSIKESVTKNALNRLTKELREYPQVQDLAYFLKKRVADMEAGEDGFERLPSYALTRSNNKIIHWYLARVTAWLEEQTGGQKRFSNLISKEKKKEVEIEHLIASNQFDHYEEEFGDIDNFNLIRNQMGALILIRSGVNQSLQDQLYTNKLDLYQKENIWAQSLHSSAYKNHPQFQRLIDKYNFSMTPHESDLTKEYIDERNQLLIQICEAIWDMQRFDFALLEGHKGKIQGTAAKTKAGDKVTVTDLIRVGKRQVGQELVGGPDSRRVTAKVRADGQIEGQNGKIGSLSRVAKDLTRRKAVSGWTFWHTQDTGQSLDTLRKEIQEDEEE